MIRLLTSLLTWLSLSSLAWAEPERPNVVVILADDLGHTDLGCQGNTFIETPHLDRLAADGLRFTTAYSACTVCSPTRAAMLTGQSPARLHITDWIAGHRRPFAKLSVPDWTMHLPHDTYSLGEAFRSAGYATASMGKWHLGGPDYYPEKHGFDVNIAGTDRGQPPSYFAPYRIPTLKEGPDGESLNDRMAVEAGQWIRQHRDKPFFLYMPQFAVHTPIQARKDVIAKYQAKNERMGTNYNAAYAALVESLDDSVGAVRKTLAELNLTDKTIFIFTSDNGGLIGGGKNPITSNPPFRAGKGSAYEGGVRVPMLVVWPGKTRPGTTCDIPAITHDIMPTLVAGLGLKTPDGHRFDGASLFPQIADSTATSPERNLYWHYPHYHPGGATPYSAIRAGDWRLIEFFEENKLELYNLKSDIGETTDLAAREPEVRDRLHQQLIAWRKEVGAQLPTPNPNHDPARANQAQQPAKKPKK